ncbi:hypothetical protein OQA88_1849 [Cercophora sp. LCS_1]
MASLGDISGNTGLNSKPTGRRASLSEGQLKTIDQAILSSLWFPVMMEREEAIHEVHTKTYEWVFCNPGVSQKPWDNLSEFLRGDSRTYWITGKAGSGKSTLVKCILENKRTRKQLA